MADKITSASTAASKLTDTPATKDDVKRLNDFMALMVMVLIIGFLILLVTLAIAFMNIMNDDSSSRDTLIQSVQQLNDKLNK